MKAIVKPDSTPGSVRLQTVRDPEPGPDEVLVAVRRAGLCHTDISLIERNAAARAGYDPRFPHIPGHEFAGEAVAGGGLEVGTPLIASPHITCGACRHCLSARSMLCPERRIIGLDVDGAFAELVRVPRRNVVALAEEPDWDVAGLAEPLAVAMHALERTPIHLGDSVAVIGPGSIGLCVLAALARTGAGAVVVVGREEDSRQLEVARALGAHAITTAEAPELVDELTGGEGVDAAIETAGASAAVRTACALTRSGGAVALVGLPSEPVGLDVAGLVFHEQQLIGVRAYDLSTWRRVERLLTGLADRLRPLVTHCLGLDDFAHAMALVARREAIKVLLDPRRPAAPEAAPLSSSS